MSSLIPAFCKDESLKQEVLSSRRRAEDGSFDVWWLGQSGFLLQWSGQCILFDPYLSDSLTKKYASTNRPHVRMSERVIAPEILDCIDIVTSSHNHTDHLDGETLIPLIAANPGIAFLVPEANREFVCSRLQCDQHFPVGLSDGDSVELRGFTFHGIPAAHNEVERDERGKCRFMGFIAKFGDFSVYHSGDTLWFDGLEKILAPFGVDVAFLPINGNDPSRGVAGNLNTAEAAALGKAIGAGCVIPHHYHMFEFNTADPRDFAAAAEKAGQPFAVLAHGQKWTYRRNQP